MKKFAFACLLLTGTIFLFSCQKEIDFSDPSQGSNNGGSGSNGSTANTYLPITTGTWWKYKDSLTGNVSTGTVLNLKKNINNVSYSAVATVMGSQADTSWMAAAAPNYFLYSKGVNPSTLDVYDLLFHYLNDTASIGYNWTYNAGHGNGFTAWVKTTIVEKNISLTVAGKTYPNVIHTRLELSYDILGTIMEAGSYDYYIAKGVGIVKVRSKLTFMGIVMMETCSDLIDYSIK